MNTQPLDDTLSNPHLGPELSIHQGSSKKARKRTAKAAKFQELKLERRAREKETKKHKRRERAKAITNGQLGEIISRKWRRTNDGGEPKVFNARVVVDLGFDELMSDKEIGSLTSQLAYTYSANRHATQGFSTLTFTSLNGRTKQRLDAMNDASYRRWLRTEWLEESYDRLWSEFPQSLSEEPRTQALPRVDRRNVVYLTADSSEELLELSEGEIYIIGGICDHNRYKSLCLNKAIKSQLRHARLPIGRYISLATRKVLTVNQVLEILLKWIDSRDWEEAFWAVIPKRKFQGERREQGEDERHGVSKEEDNGGQTDAGEETHTPGGMSNSEVEIEKRERVDNPLREGGLT